MHFQKRQRTEPHAPLGRLKLICRIVGNGRSAAQCAQRKVVLSLLHPISPSPSSPRGSIVFVHGLSGDPFKTWQSSEVQASFWPGWLAADATGVAVYTLQYEAHASTWFGHAMELPDRATDVLGSCPNNWTGYRSSLSAIVSAVCWSSRSYASDLISGEPGVLNFSSRLGVLSFLALRTWVRIWQIGRIVFAFW